MQLPALSFLVLIGSTLIAERFDVHLSKATIYGPIAFAIAVETPNLLYRRRHEAGRTI